MSRLGRGLFCVEDYRMLARRRLPAIVFDYLDGGAEDESGLARNASAFDHWEWNPHRLVDVSRRDQSIELFGQRLQTPFVIAPTGLNGAFWPKGDLALARAAARAGVPFTLSTASTMSIEQVADAGGELWFQLYVVHRDLTRQLVQRARDAGYSTLVLTVDVNVNGLRLRDLRNRFAVPFKLSLRTLLDAVTHPRWLYAYLNQERLELKNFSTQQLATVEAQAALLRREMDASLSWDDLRRLRDEWPGRLLVKGILTAQDALRCQEAGADGVIVSNHGGRQLADLPAPAHRLSEIVSVVPDATVLFDSAIRCGADVVKAMALGARAVMLGRATLYGLASGGEQGVADVIELLKRDVDRTLALIGCPTLEQLDSRYLAQRQS